MTSIATLNETYSIPEHLTFQVGPGGLATAEIQNAQASASICLLGAHVMHFQPAGEQPVLWMSQMSNFAVGQAIRGGIPICWPWFGPHPEDPSKPAHGFARTSLWEVAGSRTTEDGATELRLTLSDCETSRALWPHKFQLELTVTVGTELSLSLAIRNPGAEAFGCSSALHSYFAVSDITQVQVLGLEDCRYIDKVAADTPTLQQRGAITFSGETDRIYLDTTATCQIDDPGCGRRIVVAKSGSRSTVVWNPWTDKSIRMPDFGDLEYPGMVCVETTNAADDARNVPPAGEHLLQTRIGLAK
jgi:D-hexose-6-phosphate mutarotase